MTPAWVSWLTFGVAMASLAVNAVLLHFYLRQRRLAQEAMAELDEWRRMGAQRPWRATPLARDKVSS